jgi:hypothetical protein
MSVAEQAAPASSSPPAGHHHAAMPPPGGAAGTDRGTWTPWTPYAVGDAVEWHGTRYTCRQAHTSQPDWEPSIWTLALWLPT